MIIEKNDDPLVPSLKEIVAMETIQLIEQQKRLSVRVLAEKFEKGLATAAKLSNEERWKENVPLDRHVLLKKLRDLLKSLKGRVAGSNKDDVEESISMVEALAFQIAQSEGNLLQEKSEIKSLAASLKQATEDAKKVVEEERAFAHAEIYSARKAVNRVEQTLREQEEMSRASEKQNIEELMKEVQEARRIKMLHQPSKVMDMEHELKSLRVQLAEKSMYSIQLRKQLEIKNRPMENKSNLYELDGLECIGSCLQVISCNNAESTLDISNHSIQWFRVSEDGNKKELISGATKSQYAPEPFDVGKNLHVEIVLGDKKILLATTGPIDPASGLGEYVESLFRKLDTTFNVVVVQINGHDRPPSIHVFHVGKMRLKLCRGKRTKTKQSYSKSMQLCGVRGGGSAATKAIFWQPRKDLSYILAFESERERNAAIMLARRFAYDCNKILAGPNDYILTGT